MFIYVPSKILLYSCSQIVHMFQSFEKLSNLFYTKIHFSNMYTKKKLYSNNTPLIVNKPFEPIANHYESRK